MNASLSREEIIAIITTDSKGTNGFNNRDLLRFFARYYDEDKWEDQLSADIRAYRVELQRITLAQDYSLYCALTIIALLGTLGLINTNSSQPNSAQETGYMAPQIFLAVAVGLIKKITDPIKILDQGVLDRLLAIEQYAINAHLISDENNWVMKKIKFSGKLQQVTQEGQGIILAKSMSNSVLSSIVPNSTATSPQEEKSLAIDIIASPSLVK